MLEGVDVSAHQSLTVLKEWLPKVDFVIVKATEGRTYTDPSHDGHVLAARASGKLVGHYHFARPDRNGPTYEAESFVKAAGALPGEALVLDFEPYDSRNGGLSIDMGIAPGWVLAFTTRVRELTGAPCWVYLDGNIGTRLMAVATPTQAASLRRLPLWKATYGPSMGTLLGWESATAWQWTSTPVDRNHFYGDRATWAALAIPDKTKQPVQEDDMFTDADSTKLDAILNYAKGGANFASGAATYSKAAYDQSKAALEAVRLIAAALPGLPADVAAKIAELVVTVKIEPPK